MVEVLAKPGAHVTAGQALVVSVLPAGIACLPACLATCLPACLPGHLPACLSAWPPSGKPASQCASFAGCAPASPALHCTCAPIKCACAPIHCRCVPIKCTRAPINCPPPGAVGDEDGDQRGRTLQVGHPPFEGGPALWRPPCPRSGGQVPLLLHLGCLPTPGPLPLRPPPSRQCSAQPLAALRSQTHRPTPHLAPPRVADVRSSPPFLPAAAPSPTWRSSRATSVTMATSWCSSSLRRRARGRPLAAAAMVSKRKCHGLRQQSEPPAPGWLAGS